MGLKGNSFFTPERKQKWNQTIFHNSTPNGKKFDVILICAIIFSVIVVLLDSISELHKRFKVLFLVLEWFMTALFTLEYIVRIKVAKNKWQYIFSVYGIVDLVAILPSFLGIFIPKYQYLIVLRSLRVLRIFKIFRMWRFMEESSFLVRVLYNGYRKIVLFMLFMSLLVIIIGSMMYIIESDTPGFESIPDSIYWAVVTMTTVGYGDIAPVTHFGRFLSVIVMLSGYSIIAVSTGILTSEMAVNLKRKNNKIMCPRCGCTDHDKDARFCKICGESLEDETEG